MTVKADAGTSPAPRIQPIPVAQWNETILDALGAFPTGLKFVLSGHQADPSSAPRGSNVLGVLSQHPPLAKAFLTFNTYIATASSLPPRLRELIILRISWLRYSEYEFIQHTIIGQRVGLTAADIERIQQDTGTAGWDDADATVLHAVDELHLHARIQDQTWNALKPLLDTRQIMDLLFLVGCYHTLALVMNSLDVPLEPGTTPLDDQTRAKLYAAREGTR
jgi:alkylhydroperoxidase family enzyme